MAHAPQDDPKRLELCLTLVHGQVIRHSEASLHCRRERLELCRAQLARGFRLVRRPEDIGIDRAVAWNVAESRCEWCVVFGRLAAVCTRREVCVRSVNRLLLAIRSAPRSGITRATRERPVSPGVAGSTAASIALRVPSLREGPPVLRPKCFDRSSMPRRSSRTR